MADNCKKPEKEDGDDEEEGEAEAEVNFRGFLQLMRQFLDDSDAQMLKKEEECIERTGFSQDDVLLWRDVFTKFDLDRSGAYDPSEGKKLLGALGIQMDRAASVKYGAIFKEVDEDGSGDLDFAEFLLLIKKLIDEDFAGIAALAQKKD